MTLRVAVVDSTPWLCSRSAPPPDAITITHSPRYGNSAKIVFWTKQKHDANPSTKAGQKSLPQLERDTNAFIYLFIYLLCKSYQGTRKIMQKGTKRD